MGKKNISLITTVLNEENKIEDFFKSVNNQSLLPNEVVIVDGGSSDKTVSLINNLKNRYKRLNIRLIVKSGNRSVGRNVAIKNAKYEFIAVTDVGCILDKNWIKNITLPFLDKNIDIVSGFYKPTYKNIFQKCLSTYTSTMPDKIDKDNFLPSSRSVAFRKQAWIKVKGYPEELDTCEDLIFDKKLKEKGFNFYFQKSAFVYWPQRENLKEAFFQFFSYAFGDGMARFFRPSTPFLYIRYATAFYLLFLAFVMKSTLLNIFILLCLLGYIFWSIFKNYKYVKNKKALIYLPILQFTSDFSVLIGTLVGYVRGVNVRNLFRSILGNKGIVAITILYVLFILSGISWGIPGLEHPFTYHMDEWHFSQAIRTFLKFGSGSISGAASIPLYHIVSTLVFLIPFYLLKIIDPFLIKSSLENLMMQNALFEVLRLHTLFYGVLSVVVIYAIFKKVLRFKPIFLIALFIINPIFLLLSGFYKYDITLIFWIITAIYFIFKFYELQKFNMFLFAAISVGFALSTKFTAAPLFIGFVLSYFIFAKEYNFKKLLLSLITVFFVFSVFGIPDMILGKGSYFELLNSTLVQGPQINLLYNIGSSSQAFLLFKEFPSMFGIFLILLFYTSIIYYTFILVISAFKRNKFKFRIELFLYLLSILFLISTLAFGIDGGGNRALVLLPFILLLSGLLLKDIVNKSTNNLKLKNLLYIILILGFSLQIIQSYSWLLIKYSNDPRKLSSEWIIRNIPKRSAIGLENIPIYQMLPDITLKEFYAKQYNTNVRTEYSYKVVSASEDTFPKYIIITNDYENVSYLKKSPKKDLIKKINSLNYNRIKTFTPNTFLYDRFSDKLFLIIANILPVPVNISIYEKE